MEAHVRLAGMQAITSPSSAKIFLMLWYFMCNDGVFLSVFLFRPLRRVLSLKGYPLRCHRVPDGAVQKRHSHRTGG